MLETPRILRYVSLLPASAGAEERDNASGAANQQERLNAYLAGFVDEEGVFTLPSASTTGSAWLTRHHAGLRTPRRRGLFENVTSFEAQLLLSSKQGSSSSSSGSRERSRPANPTASQASNPRGSKVSVENPQRPYAEHHTQRCGEEMVRPAWRHAESGRNDLTPPRHSVVVGVTIVSVPIHCGRRRLEGSCP